MEVPEPSDFDLLVERSLAELRLKNEAHAGLWGLGRTERWDADLAAGTIRFTRPDGIVASAAVQVVGTYNTGDGTWLWGWDHPSVPPALGAHARAVRDWGEAHGVAELVTRKLACDEADAWTFAALACTLGGAQGAYRGPAGPTLVFMTFGEVRLSGPGGAPAAP